MLCPAIFNLISYQPIRNCLSSSNHSANDYGNAIVCQFWDNKTVRNPFVLLWRWIARPIPKYNLEMAKSSKLEFLDPQSHCFFLTQSTSILVKVYKKTVEDILMAWCVILLQEKESTTNTTEFKANPESFLLNGTTTGLHSLLYYPLMADGVQVS
jgi:hypothetical protein